MSGKRLSGLERGRLRWRARRGMLELDLLLIPYFDEVFPSLPDSEQQVFVRLLEQEDPDLLQWVSRQAIPDDPELAAMVESILRRVQP